MKKVLVAFSMLAATSISAYASDYPLTEMYFKTYGLDFTDLSTGNTQLIKFVEGTDSINYSLSLNGKVTNYPGDTLGVFTDYQPGSAIAFESTSFSQPYNSFSASISAALLSKPNTVEFTASYTGVLDYDLSNTIGLKFNGFREGEALVSNELSFAYLYFSIDNGDSATGYGNGYFTYGQSQVLPSSWINPEQVWYPIADSNLVTIQFRFGVSAVPTIPEPSSYALLGLGLGIIGFAAKRRHQRC